MHFSNLTFTNKKRKNTDKPGLDLLTFRVVTKWLKNPYFDRERDRDRERMFKKKLFFKSFRA